MKFNKVSSYLQVTWSLRKWAKHLSLIKHLDIEILDGNIKTQFYNNVLATRIRKLLSTYKNNVSFYLKDVNESTIVLTLDIFGLNNCNWIFKGNIEYISSQIESNTKLVSILLQWNVKTLVDNSTIPVHFAAHVHPLNAGWFILKSCTWLANK